MSILSVFLVVVLLLAALGGLPHWSYSAQWGYMPSGSIVFLLIIVVILALCGKL